MMMDDDFASLAAQLADITPPTDVIDFTGCTWGEMATHKHRIEERLYELKEMLSPRTDEGRELHSERAALIVAMRQRSR